MEHKIWRKKINTSRINFRISSNHCSSLDVQGLSALLRLLIFRTAKMHGTRHKNSANFRTAVEISNSSTEYQGTLLVRPNLHTMYINIHRLPVNWICVYFFPVSQSGVFCCFCCAYGQTLLRLLRRGYIPRSCT